MSRTPKRQIAGCTIAITGAARGIGAAIAEALAGRGARVAIGDLDGDLAQATAAKLDGEAIGVALDVTDTASFAAFVERAENAHGPLDVLVNNAGIMWVGPFADEPEATALAQFDVNLHGTLRGMKLAIPPMRARGHGHIVNVASAVSKVGPSGEATYAATKHAVFGYSTAVRAELRGSGVEISVVMPGVVETELAVGTAHGRGRRLVPEEVAEAVVDVVERPRFAVYVPASIGHLTRLTAVLPSRAQDAVTRALVPDQLAQTDRAARATYERSATGNGGDQDLPGPS
jgi:NAD(P)-dependent dehydrogenase (short-subunit alcohol dehydrogenase family)